jgi:hypothetical protein
MVSFLRNPQDFIKFQQEHEKMFLFLRLKNGSEFDPRIQEFSQESSFTPLYVGIKMFLM